ncbi:MAG TPA: hypothetical protein VE251_05025, partial [Xanthobacteraceae bacterium]|nr:hypothetical protein [Xanthobacteraceae bacterium]
MPGLVAVDATEDPGDCRLSRERAVGLEQRGEDHANRGIEGGDRSKVQPNVGLRNAIVETQKGAAQLPVRRGRRQRIAQSPQQPLMDQLFLCDTRKPTASRIL